MNRQNQVEIVASLLNKVFGISGDEIQDLFDPNNTQDLFNTKWSSILQIAKRSYISKIKLLHPDKESGDLEKAKELNSAWNFVKNAKITKAQPRPQVVYRQVVYSNPFGFGTDSSATSSGSAFYGHVPGFTIIFR